MKYFQGKGERERVKRFDEATKVQENRLRGDNIIETD